MPAPEAYVQWINDHLGFNPRSQKNSDALSDFVLADLRAGCPALERALDSGRLRPRKNINVKTKVVERNVDLVIQDMHDQPDVVLPGPVVAFSIAVEHKTIMTAHGKARKNRYGDIIAYSNHMHNHWRDCIAAAIVVINTSLAYQNPDAFAKDLVRPQFKMDKIVKATSAIFAGIPLRDSSEDPSDQPEALAVIVVDYDGANPATLITDERAPQIGEPHHYDSFLNRICELYDRRFPIR
ncbi:MAG: hypothetical protein ACREDR_17320 [Blastocatellia bacterium]